MLSEKEFAEAMDRGEYSEFSDRDDPSFNDPHFNYPYYSYQDWHEYHKSVMYSCLIYDIATGNTEVFASGELTNYPLDDGSISLRHSGYEFLGIYEGQLVYSVETEPVDTSSAKMSSKHSLELCFYDVKTGKSEPFLKITAGSGSVLSDSDLGISMEGDIRYSLFTENDTVIHYRYSLVTGQTTELFEDIWEVSFRVSYETSEYFIGSLYKNHNDTIKYIISKDDYYAGNFDAAVKIWR
jgi:hypothetical protein